MGQPLMSVLLAAFLLARSGLSTSVPLAPQNAPTCPGEGYTGAMPASASPGPQHTSVEEADSDIFPVPTRLLQQLQSLSTSNAEVHHIKFVESNPLRRNPLSASGLEELLLVMVEALEDLKRHLEDTTAQQEDSPDSSTVSRRLSTDASLEGSVDSSGVLSRQKRSNLYPFYMVRNIITLIQVTLVLTRKMIVLGQFFYNKFNMPP